MLKYKFYCPICKKEVPRKEICSVVTQFESTPRGLPREVIVRAFHSINCKGKGDLQIKVLENNQTQNKLNYSYDEVKSGRNNEKSKR